MLTDASNANTSGKVMEEELRLFLNTNDISYKHAKTDGIDFIIETTKSTLFVDCKNQNSMGSAEEKLPHTVWKYWRKYGYKEVYIIRGSHIPHKTIYEHLEWYPFTTHIVTMDEFIALLKDQPLHQGIYEHFTPLIR
jgi:hypothetical protein